MIRTIISANDTPPPSACPPQINLAPRDVAALADELVAYHAEFAPLFQRAEQRHWALAYLQGQLLQLERKSIEPMALALDGGDVQAMQQFISLGAWDDQLLLEQHQQLVAQTLGDQASGVLILDGCDFAKQGSHSVGVARQWCGALGKVANCQASVVACYASRHGYTLVDRRLYLPEQWFSKAYRLRRECCGVPAKLIFQTHWQLAWELIKTLHQRQVLPFHWVTCEEGFGKNPALLEQIATCELYYLAHSTEAWQQRPVTFVPPGSGRKGRPPQRPRLAAHAPEPLRVDQIAAQLPRRAWQLYQIKAGAKGPLLAEFAFVRVVVVRDGLPGADNWLVLRRSLDAAAELKTYLSNAPVTIPHSTLVEKSGMRWPIETAILEAKSEVGMDQYQVRSWVGWHHHMTLSLLALWFLQRERLRLGGKNAGGDGRPGTGHLHGAAEGAGARRGPDRGSGQRCAAA
jgi:SRSO17 transposase